LKGGGSRGRGHFIRGARGGWGRSGAGRYCEYLKWVLANKNTHCPRILWEAYPQEPRTPQETVRGLAFLY